MRGMKTMELIDTHAHLYLEDFGPDIDVVMQRAMQEGVSRIYLPSLDSAHYEMLFNLEARFPDQCFAMAGIHPCYIGENYARELELLRTMLAGRRFAAVGEIGLDYYWDTTFRKEQKIAFEQQMGLALEYELPIVIHSRNSMEDTIGMLQSARGTRLKGIFHCFSGSLENARDIIDCGMYLGIGGVITYKNAGLAEVIAEVPLEHIVLETDAPYLTPVPFRGKRNESSYLRYIVARLAEVKKMSEEVVAAVTTENAKRVFG